MCSPQICCTDQCFVHGFSQKSVLDSLDEATRLDAIIIDFSKAFGLVPHDRLLEKIAASGVDSRVVVWSREFLIDRSQRVRVGRHY